mgnify:CR=1 FL=1
MLLLKNVSFSYNITPVLKKINLQVKKGENVSIIGSSGCGKSTLLQLIYGLHQTTGKVFWGEKQLLGPDFNIVPGESFIKYLAQDFDLMPPLSVEENVGKHLSNMFPAKKKKRVRELLRVVEMQDMAKAKAGNLSGGQMQRVALARALANEPELLLLDEPFSHIDHFRKNNLRRRLFEYLKQKQVTCIIATHDSTDALSFADQTIVLKDGKIHASGTPEKLFNNPPNKYVAALFGDVNEIKLNSLDPEKESTKKILLYPHEIEVTGRGSLNVKVQESYFKGKNYLIKGKFKDEIIFFEHHLFLPKDEEVMVHISPDLIKLRS